MKVKKTLTEILKNQTIGNNFDFSGSCPDKDGTTQTFTIFSTAFFINEIEHNYFNRVAFVDPDNSFTDLVAMFTQWKTDRGQMYARMAYAYTLGYNPIENYSSIENHTGHDDFDNKKKVTHTWTNDTLTRTYTNDNVQRTYNNDAIATTHAQDKATTTYNSVQDAATQTKYGVNSSNAVNVSGDTNTRTGNEVLEYSGTKTDTHTGGYTDSHTGSTADTHTGSYSDENSGKDSTIYNSTITKSGNIGIQTAADMKRSEYDNLVQDLALRAVFDFLDRFTFYSEGVDLIW